MAVFPQAKYIFANRQKRISISFKFLIARRPIAGQAGYEICGIHNRYLKYATIRIVYNALGRAQYILAPSGLTAAFSGPWR